MQAVVNKFKVLSQNLCAETEESHESLIRYSRIWADIYTQIQSASSNLSAAMYSRTDKRGALAPFWRDKLF
jgi:hypothetical protein